MFHIQQKGVFTFQQRMFQHYNKRLSLQFSKGCFNNITIRCPYNLAKRVFLQYSEWRYPFNIANGVPTIQQRVFHQYNKMVSLHFSKVCFNKITICMVSLQFSKGCFNNIKNGVPTIQQRVFQQYNKRVSLQFSKGCFNSIAKRVSL